MKNILFYTILFLSISLILTIGLKYNFDFIYWICCIGALMFYTWNKDVMTGTDLFGNTEKNEVLNYDDDEEADNLYNGYFHEDYPAISEEEKDGFITLTKLCVATRLQPKLIDFFNQLRDYSEEEFSVTLYRVAEYLYANEISFIISSDMQMKSGFENSEVKLKNSSKENFNLSIEFQKHEKCDGTTANSDDEIFEYFDKPLRENGLQIGFIDTKYIEEPVEYTFFIHKISDKETVKNALNKIGYNYYEKTYYR